MGKLNLKNAFAVLGFSCLWAYVQKGFLSTRLVWAPEGDFPFAAGTLLSSLLVFLFLFSLGHARIERILSTRKLAFLGVLCAAFFTQLIVYLNIIPLNDEAAYAFCVVYYALHAFILLSLFFAWMLYFVGVAYNINLSSAVAMLLIALLVTRVITMPYLFIWNTFSREETLFLVTLSGVLWLACFDSNGKKDGLRFSANLLSSSLMRRYLPAFLMYLFGGIASRIIQSFSEDFWQMQVYNVSREILCFAFLTLCIAVFFLPKKAREKFSRRDTFFLAAGLALGAVVGQLLGVNRELPIERLFFDFIETSRAILLVVSLLLVFLIVYEESISPVLSFGVFVLLPLVVWRFFNLAAESAGPLSVPSWTYLPLLAVIAVLFLVTSLLLLFVFVGSNAFLTSLGDRSQEGGRRDLVETIAREHGLTERETSVFGYLSMGYTAKRIGEKLYISPYTAQNHIRCIYAKLGVNSKQAVLEFIEDQVMRG